MTERTLRLSALVAAAALTACAIALLAASREAGAAFPGSNGQIAFYKSVGGGNDDIFAVDADGSGLRNVTNSRAGETVPAWSPDGKRLVYERSAPNRDLEIGIVQAGSGSKRAITDNPYNDLDPSFSPDGDEIVFANQRNSATSLEDIYAMNRDGGGLRRLTDNAERDRDPVFSPDGTTIAFQRTYRSGRSTIWTMGADGGNEKVLVAPPADGDILVGNPDWSPDGTEVAFSRYAGGGQSDIYAVGPDRAGLRNVTKTPNANEGDPSFSPDGRRIAFLRTDRQTGQNDIWTVRASDGSDPAQVTDTPDDPEFAPTWQPAP